MVARQVNFDLAAFVFGLPQAKDAGVMPPADIGRNGPFLITARIPLTFREAHGNLRRD